MPKYLLFFFCLISFPVLGQNLVLTDAIKTYTDFDPYLTIWVDSQKNTPVEKVIGQTQFQPYEKLKNLKFDSKYAYWLRVSLTNRSDSEDWVLSMGREINWIEVYLLDSAKIQQSYRTGFLVPASQKPIQHTIDETIEFTLLPHQTATLLIRVENTNCVPVIWDLRLYEALFWGHEFVQKTMIEYGIYFVFTGMLIIMIVYNFLIFLINREKVYGFYAFYMFLIGLFIVQSVGLWHTFFMPEYPQSSYFIRIVGVNLGAFAYCIFAQKFLDTRLIFPQWHRVLNIIKVVMFSNFFFSAYLLFVPFNIHLYKIFTSLLFIGTYPIIISFSVFIFLTNRRNILVQYFISGTIILSLSLFSGLLISYFINPNTNVGFFSVFGVVFEIIIFSLGLGYRMKQNEEEKRYMTNENARILKEQNQVLEQKVQERTSEIRIRNEELHHQQEELQESNKQIQDSIRAALSIQQAILPSEHRMRSVFEHYFVIYRPKDIVSGDFYWLAEKVLSEQELAVNEQLDSKKTLLPPNSLPLSTKHYVLAVADCTGHGVAGAFMTMICNTLLDRIVRVEDVTDPAQVLTMLDQEIAFAFADSDRQESKGMDIALITVEQNHENFTVRFAGAKRSILVFDGKNMEEYKGTRKSIDGRKRADRIFENHEIHLSKGAMLYLFTDGFSDQNNSRREKIGYRNLCNLIEKNALLDLEEQKQHLEQYFDDFKQNTEQRDDVLLIGIKL